MPALWTGLSVFLLLMASFLFIGSTRATRPSIQANYHWLMLILAALLALAAGTCRLAWQ